jgi:hypothetical protein
MSDPTDMSARKTRPDPTEYAPYYGRYTSLVPDGDILEILGGELQKTMQLLGGVPEAQAGFRYAPDKWSIKELVGHVIDTERVFAYRALRFSRNDATPLPGYDQNEYARNATHGEYPLAELVFEFEAARRSHLLLFRHLAPDAWTRQGRANDNPVSVRALAWIMAGHEMHHREILRTRYLAEIR